MRRRWGTGKALMRHRVDNRAEVEVVLSPFVAPAHLPKYGEEVWRLVWVLVVDREVCGALELVLARRPTKGSWCQG